jgi:transposase-like protein
MQRRRFGREFKVEAVRLIRERGVSIAQAARDLDVHENVLRKWVKDFAAYALGGALPRGRYGSGHKAKTQRILGTWVQRPERSLTGLPFFDDAAEHLIAANVGIGPVDQDVPIRVE